MLYSNLFFRISFIAFSILLASSVKIDHSLAQRDPKPPVQLVNGYPQFQLNGQPFFAHSAAFFYSRIPRDEWGASLAKLKAMGVNTIDLYIAWNWHEPEEGKLDFDGRTNPRRDVKGLLEMIDEMGFAVIARPGPVILNEWKNGGYPDWLLRRPEYQMNEVARLDGHYPPLSGLSPTNSEEASRQWLANETHLKYTRKWFGDVMRELLKDRQATNAGNVIAIQLDDDQAINRANYNGPVFWKHMNTLAGYLREAGASVPLYLNPTDMRVSAAGASHDIGVMGQWYFNFGSDPALRWEDTATLQFYTETLKTQPHFPPMIIEYQAGWYGTGDDTYAKTADPTNTLLSSRVMIGHGLRGLNYFPVQDTLYPAGYEVPWANHHYTWESALNLAREERPRASAVHRNGRLIVGLGRELATAHKAADLGLVYPISSFDQPSLTRDDVMRISQTQMRIQQYCQLNQLAVEYIDLEFQPLESLKRRKALLLPVLDGERGSGEAIKLSETARRKLVDYVKAGGILVCTPVAPQIEELNGNERVVVVPDFWRAVPIEPGGAKRDDVIAAAQNASVEFVSRLSRLGVNRRVKARVALEGDRQPASSSAGATIEPNFIAAQLVSGEGERGHGFLSVASFDDRRAMRVSLNVADATTANGRLELPEFRLRPRDAMMLPLQLPLSEGGQEKVVYATAELIKREVANGKVFLRFFAPDPAEIVLALPHAPQGAVSVDGAPATASYDAQKGWLTIKLVPPRTRKEDDSDRREHEHDIEIVYETGLPELTVKTMRLNIGFDNQIIVDVVNRASQPLKGKMSLMATRLFKSSQLSLDVDLKPRETRQFKFHLPVSAKAVEGDQVVLRAVLNAGERQYFSPSVTAEILPRFSWRVFPASAWLLRADTQVTINPPLIYPSDDSATTAKFNLRMVNNSAEDLTLTRQSLLVNSFPLRLRPDEEYLSTYTFNFPPGTKAALNPFAVTISDGKTTETAKVNFVALRKGEAVAFAYDIDRDGFDDYVLENENLRLIISPNAGARAFALINKRTGANVFTSVGGLRDKFVELDPQDPTRNPRRKRGMYGTFNRQYAAEIKEGMGSRVVLTLSHDAPDVYPAGARIERSIVLNAGAEHFTVDYRVTPSAKTADGKQSFWSSNSIAAGDPNNKARQFVAADGPFDFAPAKNRSLNVAGGWVAAQISEQETFGVFWRPGEVNAAEVEMKDFSSLVNLKFKPFASAEAATYRLVFYLGAMRAGQLAAMRARMLGE
jgi:hypothetical protein